MIFNVGAGGASNAKSVKYDNSESGLNSTNVQGAIDEIDNSLSDKVNGFTDGTYTAVTGLAYDATNKKLGLKVGADTVIPFSSCASGNHTFSASEVFEIDTGLSEIKRFVLYNDPTVDYQNFIIYDCENPTKYKYVYKYSFTGNNTATIGDESTASSNSYKVMSISGGKITLKAPDDGSDYKWLDATWMAQ